MIMHILFVLSIGLFYALWRRCYGGLDVNIWKKIFPKYGSALHRHFWRIVGLVFVFSIMFFYNNSTWYLSLYTTLILQFIFWDWTFGMYMGMGSNKDHLTDEIINEYNKQIFSKFLNWLIDEQYRYGRFYDYLGMLFRFSAPGLLLFFIPSLNIGMCFLGTIIATSYLINKRFYEKNQANGFLKKNFAELSAGFFTGIFLII